MSGPLGFDLLNPSSFLNGHPFAAYDEMRQRAPVFAHAGDGDTAPFWALTRHADVHAVSHDTERFTSSQGFNMTAASRRSLDPAVAAAMGRNILTYDPPEHAEFKAILMPGFSAANLRRLEEKTATYVAAILDAIEGREEIDLVREVSSILPIKVLCALLGIPDEDQPKILTWTNRMVGADDPDFSPDPSVASQAFFEVFAYGKWLIEERRKNPKDDLMTLVAQGLIGGSQLSDATRDSLCATLIAAGNETTRNAISGALMLLSEAPDQRSALVADPGLVANAVEELLRRFTPVIHMMRTAKTDVDVGGQLVKQGEKVVLLYGAANHDPEAFEDPYRLDIARPNARRHLAFGTGVHLCIGQRLAQMEMRVLLVELLRRFPQFSTIGSPAWLRSNFVSGIKTLRARPHG
jgi:cytochrome P450